ncbi:MAG: nucleotidyltransferase family protein [Rectinemataceae bacterium]|nr:nucleotidyltransferase family protein [Rectinemataceae bacterium]
MKPQEARLPCILLAAGASSRMGSHKLLLPVGGEPMVRRTARVALTRCYPLIVVTGYGSQAVEEALIGLDGVITVFNPAWATGRVISVIRGIQSLPATCPGFFLHHADMPFVSEAAFDALERAKGVDVALVAGRSGKPGHPVYFPQSYIPAILALAQGESLKRILADKGCVIVETGCDGVLEDMDSPDDYDALCRKYGLVCRPAL